MIKDSFLFIVIVGIFTLCVFMAVVINTLTWMIKIPHDYPRLAKFAVVGGSGVFVHFGILYGLTTAGLIYWESAMIAIVIAMAYNYTLNNRWTFKEQRRRGKSFLRGLGKYAMVSFAGDGIYLGFMVLLTEQAHLYYLLSAGISMASIMIVRYMIVRKFIWGKAHTTVKELVV